MQTTIYYFSGTGNSLKSARELTAKIENCTLIPIAKVWKENYIPTQTKTIGFVFPIYFWGVPHIVCEFLKVLDLEEVDYIFALATRGSSLGIALYDLENILQEKAKELSAGFYLNMPSNYLPLSDVPPEKTQEKLFERARYKIDEIAQIINQRGNEVEGDNFILRFIASLIHKFWLKGVHLKDKNFWSDHNCTSCDICVRVCPVDNIILEEGRPKWLQKCEQCFACLHFCPVRSIQYRQKTIKRNRYHHPDITVEDIMEQK